MSRPPVRRHAAPSPRVVPSQHRVTVILKPCGRGRWSARMEMKVEGSRSPLPLDVRVGERFQFHGTTWRVVGVLT